MPDSRPDPRARHRALFAQRLPEETHKVTWPQERLFKLRDERLRELIRHAREHSPWHRERLHGVNVDGLSGQDLSALPTMTKAEMMDNWDAISCDPELTLARALEHLDQEASKGPGYLLGRYEVVISGGSSGRRAVVPWDFDGLLETALSRFRHLAWVLAQSPPPGPPSEARMMPTGALHISGVLDWVFSLPGIEIRTFPPALPMDEVVASLVALQPTALLGYPSLVHQLSIEQLHGRLQIAPYFVAVSGEPIPVGARHHMERAWGRPIVDVWGASEVGELAISNPLASDGSPDMHLIEDACIAEPVDADGQPVPPGVASDNLYVTNLLNRTFPVIRYELGDSPTLLADNPGPWTGRRVAPIESRAYAPFVYADGTVLQVHALGLALREEPQVLEFQTHQTPTGIDVDVLLDGPADLEKLRGRLAAVVERSGMRSPTVNVQSVQNIPRDQRTGKLRMHVPLPATS